MARLIDADALKELIDVKGAKLGITSANRCNFKDMLKMVPTIDAEPVRHGHWIEKMWFVTCSACNYTSSTKDDEGDFISLNYCPNCGAKMDEEDNHA